MKHDNHSMLFAEDFIGQKERNIELIVPQEEFQMGKTELEVLKNDILTANFKKKMLYCLKHVWKFPFNCMKVGIAWNRDQSMIMIDAQLFSDFLGIKQNSLNKNLAMYGINLVPSSPLTIASKKWRCRKSMLFKLNSLTTDDDINMVRAMPLDKISHIKNQTEIQFSEQMWESYMNYFELRGDFPKKSSSVHSPVLDLRSENTSPNLSNNASPDVIKKVMPKSSIMENMIKKDIEKRTISNLDQTLITASNQDLFEDNLCPLLFDKSLNDVPESQSNPYEDSFIIDPMGDENVINLDGKSNDEGSEMTNYENQSTNSIDTENWCDFLNSMKINDSNEIKELYMKEVCKLKSKKIDGVKRIINFLIDSETQNSDFSKENAVERIIEIYGTPHDFVSFLNELFDENGKLYEWVDSSIVIGYDWHLSIDDIKEPVLFIGDKQYRIIKWSNGQIATIADGKLIIKKNLSTLLFDYFKLDRHSKIAQYDSYYNSMKTMDHWLPAII